MKPIELTQEHKDKLLEMCRVLFPENFCQWRFMPTLKIGFLSSEEIETYFIQYIDDEKGKSFSIHWFEFCMTHLCTKIFNNLKLYLKTDIMSYRGHLCQNINHPIDYLYEEFKKLK